MCHYELNRNNLSILYENIREQEDYLFYRQKQNENSHAKNRGRSMLNQSNKVLCICVSLQESRESIKEEPEMNIYDIFS